eukprot:9474657-Pyramimonas_sp.AAC.1
MPHPPTICGRRRRRCATPANQSQSLRRKTPHPSTNRDPSVGICLTRRPIAGEGGGAAHAGGAVGGGGGPAGGAAMV